MISFLESNEFRVVADGTTGVVFCVVCTTGTRVTPMRRVGFAFGPAADAVKSKINTDAAAINDQPDSRETREKIPDKPLDCMSPPHWQVRVLGDSTGAPPSY